MSANCFSSRYFLFKKPDPVVICLVGALMTGFNRMSDNDSSSSSNPSTSKQPKLSTYKPNGYLNSNECY